MSDLTRHNGQWASYWRARQELSALHATWGMASRPHGPVWAAYRRERARIWRAHGLTYRAWNRHARLLARTRL